VRVTRQVHAATFREPRRDADRSAPDRGEHVGVVTGEEHPALEREVGSVDAVDHRMIDQGETAPVEAFAVADVLVDPEHCGQLEVLRGAVGRRGLAHTDKTTTSSDPRGDSCHHL